MVYILHFLNRDPRLLLGPNFKIEKIKLSKIERVLYLEILK